MRIIQSIMMLIMYSCFNMTVCADNVAISECFPEKVRQHVTTSVMHDNAIAALSNGDMHKLDAHGGDTACQIRAVMMGDYYTRLQYTDLTPEQKQAVIASYILCQAKAHRGNTAYRITHDGLRYVLQVNTISRSACDTTEKHMKKVLTYHSVTYVQRIAEHVKDTVNMEIPIQYASMPYGDQLSYVVHNAVRQLQCGQATPCYPTLHVLLYHMRMFGRPIILRLFSHLGHHVRTLFEYPDGVVQADAMQSAYTSVPALAIEATTASSGADVFQCVNTSYGISLGILANAAYHTQYINSRHAAEDTAFLNEVPDVAFHFQQARQRADAYGFKESDDRGFAIYHIYGVLPKKLVNE